MDAVLYIVARGITTVLSVFGAADDRYICVKSMPTTSSDVLVLTLAIVCVASVVNARPKIGRRFCAHYPFAPRCLGVAAKRDGSEVGKLSNPSIPDYGDLASIVLRSKIDTEDSSIDPWDSHENDDDDDNTNKAVIVPIRVLSKIIGAKAGDLNNLEKRRRQMWMDYDMGRE